jgi:HPt (histidine-containing phosphotransfer) domain-containing protein
MIPSPCLLAATKRKENVMSHVIESQKRLPCSTEVLNLNELVDRCLGNLEFVERLLEQFEKLLARDVSVITQAAGARDLDTICQISHRIKGASANVSAPALVKVASEIEAAAKDADFDTIWSRLPVLSAERDRFGRSTPRFLAAAHPTA